MSEPFSVEGSGRFVIFHRPGPAWQKDRGPIEQVGIAEHLAYLRGLADRGIIALGGPFMEEGAGGMVITREGMTQAEARAIAEDDPAARSGLINAELHSWLVTVDTMHA